MKLGEHNRNVKSRTASWRYHRKAFFGAAIGILGPVQTGVVPSISLLRGVGSASLHIGRARQWGVQMNIFRVVKGSDVLDVASPSSEERAAADRPSWLSERRRSRRERDAERGYSINVKQVVLAFAVEFWIIGLIVVGTYQLIDDSGKLSQKEVFSALLLPAALAMVELARVPLAIATRTQTSWHIKLFAALGVLAAITVTSFSLSQLGWKTFDTRIAEATRASDKLATARKDKESFEQKLAQAAHDIDQKISAKNVINDAIAALEAQLTKISTSTGQSCKPQLGPDGKPMFRENGTPIQSCSPTAVVNAAQLGTLKAQIASRKKELDVAEGELRQSYQTAKGMDGRRIEEALTTAEAEYRTAVNNSQLHSYTSMFTGKAPFEVTESEVKNLEKYLIFIPSIAAAFASTLIAITAVRRIRAPAPVTTLSDEAAEYLFGPLVVAIRQEAKEAVRAAVDSESAPPGAANANAKVA
jgi:hypothetical protein